MNRYLIEYEDPRGIPRTTIRKGDTSGEAEAKLPKGSKVLSVQKLAKGA